MKRLRTFILSISLVFLLVQIGFVFPKNHQKVGIVFYNVENLFDTLDNHSTHDDEFLPMGEKGWNSVRYKEKLEKISEALAASSPDLPSFVGFAEIENSSVLKDLISEKLLKKAKYEFVHYESPDERGIDVGFLYSKKKVKSIVSKQIKVPMKPEDRPTRDILLVKCELKKGPEIYFFINHWPSRYGGQKESEYKRMAASKKLGYNIDSLYNINPQAYIVCMGDFNDHPDNVSVSDTLIGNRNSRLFNLMLSASSQFPGSYSYKGKWNYLDQFIVSSSLVDTIVPYIQPNSTKSYCTDKMIYTTRKGDKVPNRTYGGTNYYGGYSDHLPIYTEIVY